MNVATRHDVTLMQRFQPYPAILDDGRHKVYEQTFVNSGGEVTPELAGRHLEKIQQEHPEKSGWICFANHEGVFQEKGLWYAFRHHAKYQ